MAILKFGSFVTEGSGSLAGHTIQNSKGGLQLRTKPVPKNYPSPDQSAIRSYNKIMQQGWRDLSQSERSAWNNYAISYTIQNKYGDRHILSGHSLWMKLQFGSLASGFPLNPYLLPGMLGPELAFTWLTLAGYPFETFESSGTRIIKAINTSGFGFCLTQPDFTISIGQRYYIQINIQKNSGVIDYIVMANKQLLTPASNTVVPVNGPQSYIFTTTQNTSFAVFAFRCSQPVNFSSLNVSVKRLL